MAKSTVSYAETIAIQGFLRYLNVHWSKLIDPKDKYLIIAVSAWFHQESGGLSRVIGNNPFNIRVSPLQSGSRKSRNGNGHFAVFSSLTRGFAAAAYLLMHGNKAYGYQLALNALKQGGNQGANDFLAALARSSWDAARYGTTDWLTAYDPKVNHLLKVYLSIGGVQIANPRPKTAKPVKPMPQLPRDFNYKVIVRNYLDPWRVKTAYATRHDARSVKMDGTTPRR